MVITHEVHLRLRADREADAGADVVTELGRRIVAGNCRVRRLDLGLHRIDSSARLSEDARSDARTQVHTELRRETHDAYRGLGGRGTRVPIRGAEIVKGSLHAPLHL